MSALDKLGNLFEDHWGSIIGSTVGAIYGGPMGAVKGWQVGDHAQDIIKGDGNREDWLSIGKEAFSQSGISNDLGFDLPQNKYIDGISTAASVLQGSGLSLKSAPGFRNIGINEKGQNIFSKEDLLNSTDTGLGKGYTLFTSNLLNSLGAFDSTDHKDSFDAIGTIASDDKNHSILTKNIDEGDQTGFINNMLGMFGKPDVKNINPENRSDVNSLITAKKLSSYWSRLSPAQQSLALANTGIKNYSLPDGTSLDQKYIQKPSEDNPGLTVQDSLNLLQKGVNSFSLSKNWGQLNAVSKYAGSNQSSDQVGNLTKSLNLLGIGTDGAAAPNITPDRLAKDGWQNSPQFGIGAVSSNTQNSLLPDGFVTLLSNDSGTIAVPKDNMSSSTGVFQGGSLIGTKAGAASVSKETSTIYNDWTPVENVQKNGSLGGNALAGGLSNLAKTNPNVLGSVMANSFFKNSPQTDNKSNTDYLYNSAGVTLGRLLDGTTSKKADEAGIENIQKFPKAHNFPDAVKLLQTVFYKAGIKNQSDGYQLVNQGYYEGRFNESDATSMHQLLDIMYTPQGNQLFSTLSSGKDQGLKNIQTIDEPIKKSIKKSKSKEDLIAANRQKYSTQSSPSTTETDSSEGLDQTTDTAPIDASTNTASDIPDTSMGAAT